MSRYSIENLEVFVEQNKRDILDIRNVLKLLVKEAQDQNEKMIELSRLSKGQLEVIMSLSHTVNLITDRLDEVGKLLEKEEEE